MQFGLMFFCSSDDRAVGDRYALLTTSARFADSNGFVCVWTPERHFHPFGGLFPNPAVTSAALATMTDRVQLRAGSLIVPLHDPLRVAEEWSMVDNLSNGRAAISFGSGWNVTDFVLFPDRYHRRQACMYEQIDIIARLWRGETVTRTDTFGRAVEVALHPRPVQPALPIWITSSGSPETFAAAGRLGANVLTHLLGQDIAGVAERIARYRTARSAAGHDPEAGIVSLMLHTFIGDDVDHVRAIVKSPLCDYLRSAISLERRSAAAGGAVSGGKSLPDAAAGAGEEDEMLAIAFERYFHGASLLGPLETCEDMVVRLQEIGVDEIACLIDFGVDAALTLSSLSRLADLVRACRGPEPAVLAPRRDAQ